MLLIEINQDGGFYSYEVTTPHCDELVSLPKSTLTDYIGSLSATKLIDLNQAMKIALDISNA